jgi:hypothetical protein
MQQKKTNDLMGLRNLLIFIILGFLGLRLKALEKLPGVIFMNQLLESGVLNLKFQPKYCVRKE